MFTNQASKFMWLACWDPDLDDCTCERLMPLLEVFLICPSIDKAGVLYAMNCNINNYINGGQGQNRTADTGIFSRDLKS